MNEPPIAATWLMPMAKPRWSEGKASTMMALELAKSMAPPTPWTSRHSTSHSAPDPAWKGSIARSTEAKEKTANPKL